MMLDKVLEFLQNLSDRLGAKAFVTVAFVCGQVALLHFGQGQDIKVVVVISLLMTVGVIVFLYKRVQENKLTTKEWTMGVTIDAEFLLTGLRTYFETGKFADYVDKIKADWKANIGYIPKVMLLAASVTEKMVRDAGEAGQGSAKRDAVVEFLDDVIQLPIYLEWLDGKLIGMAIDALIGWLNLTQGHDWYATEVKLPEVAREFNA